MVGVNPKGEWTEAHWGSRPVRLDGQNYDGRPMTKRVNSVDTVYQTKMIIYAYLDGCDLTQEEIAAVMSVSQPTASRFLARIYDRGGKHFQLIEGRVKNKNNDTD